MITDRVVDRLIAIDEFEIDGDPVRLCERQLHLLILQDGGRLVIEVGCLLVPARYKLMMMSTSLPDHRYLFP